MLTSTLESLHADGSGSGASDSSGAEVLGAAVVAVADAVGDGEVLSVVVSVGVGEALGASVVSVADAVGDGEALSVVVSVAEAVGEAVVGSSVA
ncbi:hypothetical protein [Streptomyces sp. NL15-2K]|uniref:hypothetical protein n=1 Tax=Streptomyces sp. NL15-2K TaxID=376149 RepID=UPI0026EA1018|nr:MULTISPECIES: hypothetical protein [Actinomycetes]WKX11832.1 hypothetical protein Q4V64_31720 [Kutzneria buriramensis]